MPNTKKLLITLFSILLISQNAYSWNGYDYDNKTEVEIASGNLVREGMVIQFYDSKTDKYHTAKILELDDSFKGSRIKLHDLDSKRDRILIME